METAKINEKIEALEINYSRMNKLEDAQLFEEIKKAISEHVTFENENRDSTDGIFDVLWLKLLILYRKILKSLLEFQAIKKIYKSIN